MVLRGDIGEIMVKSTLGGHFGGPKSGVFDHVFSTFTLMFFNLLSTSEAF